MPLNMVENTLWSAVTWTFQGILCTCRFLWICPYNALNTITFLPLKPQVIKDLSDNVKGTASPERKGRDGPDCTTSLHKRLAKTEKGILSLKTRMGFERASWQRRFAELKKKQEELRSRLVSEDTTRPGVLVKVGSCDDQGEVVCNNDEVFKESSGSRVSEVMSSRGDACPSSLSSRLFSLSSVCDSSAVSSITSVGSWRDTAGPHRVFVPHSPMDLQPGHLVRIMLPSGRISSGAIRFLGHLQGEPELQLGVELETPDTGLEDISHQGHGYFEW